MGHDVDMSVPLTVEVKTGNRRLGPSSGRRIGLTGGIASGMPTASV